MLSEESPVTDMGPRLFEIGYLGKSKFLRSSFLTVKREIEGVIVVAGIGLYRCL